MNDGFKFLKSIIWLTQFGLSVVSPLVLSILLCVWLRDRFSVGGWIFIPGIVVGLTGSVSGLWRSLKAMQQDGGGDDNKGGISFNDHE